MGWRGVWGGKGPVEVEHIIESGWIFVVPLTVDVLHVLGVARVGGSGGSSGVAALCVVIRV